MQFEVLMKVCPLLFFFSTNKSGVLLSNESSTAPVLVLAIFSCKTSSVGYFLLLDIYNEILNTKNAVIIFNI